MFAREKPVESKNLNRSGFVTLNDFLNDIEDDVLSQSSIESPIQLKQTSIPFTRLESQIKRSVRIAKSLTIAAARPSDIKREIKPLIVVEEKKNVPPNEEARRCKS